ncbi:MAG: hypothetical protein AAGE94_07210 [Acidobacteriota bacterium]
MLLGTDAAGKDHVARVWTTRLAELGRDPIVQAGWLSGSPVDLGVEDDKSWFAHLAEATFLRVFPWIRWAMPSVLSFLIYRDLRRFPNDGRRRLVVSHSALRILAFCLGTRGEAALSASSRRAVRAFYRRSGARVIVLDVDPAVRRRRIEARLDRDDADPFDRFMLADSKRSERIEAWLVRLATDHMDAHLIVNDELDDETLWRELEVACGAASRPR